MYIFQNEFPLASSATLIVFISWKHQRWGLVCSNINFWYETSGTIVYIWPIWWAVERCNQRMPTISINIHCTCVSFSIVVSVNLIRIVIVGAVITTVTNIIPVIVILLWVVDEWAVVLQEKKKSRFKNSLIKHTAAWAESEWNSKWESRQNLNAFMSKHTTAYSTVGIVD